MYNFRTDMAVERRDLYKKANNIENDIDGIETEEEKVDEDITISRVNITNERHIYYNRYKKFENCI